MNKGKLIREKVDHISLGTGVVSNINDKYIEIIFEDGRPRSFQFPAAFAKWLKACDPDIQREIEKDIQSLPDKTMSVIPSVNTEKDAFIKNKPVERKEKKKTYIPKNIAFKCTYNDGGYSKNGIGFLDVCSDSMIRQHIRDGRRWCSNPYCPCNEYITGKLSKKKLEAMRRNGEMICYECCMLEQWKAQAGTIRNVVGEGDRIRIKNAYRNGLAVLTTRLPDTAEKDRLIFAAFLIDTIYEGDEETSGYVSAQSKYRLSFSLEEARRLLYWKYHANKNNPSKPSWGTGLFRYLAEDEGVQILRDAVKIKTGTKDETLAKEFFDIYCQLNRLIPENIGEPSGALEKSNA